MPVWLDADFFRQHLDIQGVCEVQSIEYACAKGENFASKIFRVKLERSGGRIESLIVKSRPFGGDNFNADFLTRFDVFGKETLVYQIIDRFEEIFHAVNREITFAPK